MDYVDNLPFYKNIIKNQGQGILPALRLFVKVCSKISRRHGLIRIDSGREAVAGGISLSVTSTTKL